MYCEKYLSKISLLISVLLILIVVVSCAPQMTDEELEAELAKLTPEEREELLADLEAKEGGALAGQAYQAKYVQKISPKVLKTSSTLVKQAIGKTCTPKTKSELCFIDQTCGDIPDGCGGVVQCGELCGNLQKPYCVNNICSS